MAAGLVDYVQVTLFPVITGQTGLDPIFRGAADFDLELLEHRTLDGHIQELIYRPTPPLTQGTSWHGGRLPDGVRTPKGGESEAIGEAWRSSRSPSMTHLTISDCRA